MSGNLETKHDLARYFTFAGISIRPEAVHTLLNDLVRIAYHQEKLHFLDCVLRLFKEWHQANTRVMNTANSGTPLILDEETVRKIVQSPQFESILHPKN